MTEVYLLFFQACLQIFVIFNKFLQREDPLLLYLKDEINAFLKRLASKFLKLPVIRDAMDDFCRLSFTERENQLSGFTKKRCSLLISLEQKIRQRYICGYKD